jgi:hypothetical protein
MQVPVKLAHVVQMQNVVNTTAEQSALVVLACLVLHQTAVPNVPFIRIVHQIEPVLNKNAEIHVLDLVVSMPDALHKITSPSVTALMDTKVIHMLDAIESSVSDLFYLLYYQK